MITSLSVSRKSRGAERLHGHWEWVRQSLNAFSETLGGACIEGPSLDSVHREFDLGEASGVLKAAVYSFSPVELQVVEPARLKKFATGNAMASKEEVLHAVKTVYGLDLGDDDDRADAYVLARIAWAKDNVSSLTRRCEAEVVHAILHPAAKPKRRLKSPTNV